MFACALPLPYARQQYPMPSDPPQHGFLQASRSAPILGPGLGKRHSARTVPLNPPTEGPGKYYDLVPARVYKKTNGNLVANLGTSGKRLVPLNQPTEGPDQLYNIVPLDVYKEKDGSFRFAKAFRFDSEENSKVTRTYPKFHSVPKPEVYKEPRPEVPKWQTGPPRFLRPPKTYGADQFYEPSVSRASSVPNLKGGGPRLDAKMYVRTAGADVPYYDLPNPTAYKESSRAFRFGKDQTRPSSAAECAPRHRDAPVNPTKPVDPDAPIPAWVERLALHRPRPVRPWRKPPASAPPCRARP